MDVEIVCGTPAQLEIRLYKKGTPDQREVTWSTNEANVIYWVIVPPDVFVGCPKPEGCADSLKQGHPSKKVFLNPNAAEGIDFEYTVAHLGSLPDGCPPVIRTTPVIIVGDEPPPM